MDANEFMWMIRPVVQQWDEGAITAEEAQQYIATKALEWVAGRFKKVDEEMAQ